MLGAGERRWRWGEQHVSTRKTGNEYKIGVNELLFYCLSLYRGSNPKVGAVTSNTPLPTAHILPASASQVPSVGCNCGNSEASPSRVSLELTGMYLLARAPEARLLRVQKATDHHHPTPHFNVLWNKVRAVRRKCASPHGLKSHDPLFFSPPSFFGEPHSIFF